MKGMVIVWTCVFTLIIGMWVARLCAMEGGGMVSRGEKEPQLAQLPMPTNILEAPLFSDLPRLNAYLDKDFSDLPNAQAWLPQLKAEIDAVHPNFAVFISLVSQYQYHAAPGFPECTQIAKLETGWHFKKRLSNMLQQIYQDDLCGYYLARKAREKEIRELFAKEPTKEAALGWAASYFHPRNTYIKCLDFDLKKVVKEHCYNFH